MKLKFKMIAVAAAMATIAGGARAELSTNTGNSSLTLVAFNISTGAMYVRDLGYTLSSFTPTGAVAFGQDPATGNKTPESGLVLDSSNTPNFSDATNFTSWITSNSQNTADIRYLVEATDFAKVGTNTTAAANKGVYRVIASSATDSAANISNGQIDGMVASGGATGLPGFFGAFGTGNVSKSFSSGALAEFQTMWGLDAASTSMLSLGQTGSLYYYSRSTVTGSGTANGGQFANSVSHATIQLASNGDFTYSLATAVSAVPLPDTALLMTAGLMGIGMMIRRRRSAFEA